MSLLSLLLSLFLHPVAYDPCDLDWTKVDSIKNAALNEDSVAIKKMGCVAMTNYLEESERLFWLFRWLERNPCGAGHYSGLFKSWKFEVQLVAAALKDPRAIGCKQQLGHVMTRECKSDSLNSFRLCDPFRNMKPKPIIARPPPDSR